MSSFVPLNVEIEEESQDEIDDSKEIQIEEALKLYQNAIKLHSQGPRFYDAAQSAYDELFGSEIFTWEESLTETQVIELYNDVGDSDDDSEDAPNPISTGLATGVDGTPSSLPQILYLAYKNHGQFQLDRLREYLSRIEDEDGFEQPVGCFAAISDVTYSSLSKFVQALDKDDTDLELWRLVSRIGGFLGSHRIARYCLETVLDNDEGNFDAWTEPFGLEVGFAEEQLKPLLKNLDDQLTRSQLPASFGKHGNIIFSFRKRIDPCPYIPTTSSRPGVDNTPVKARSEIINVPLRSYASCGKALLLQISREAQGLVKSNPGATYSLALPSDNAHGMLPPAVKCLGNDDATPALSQAAAVSRNGDRNDRVEDAPRPETDSNDAGTNGVTVLPMDRSSMDDNQVTLVDAAESSPMIVEARTRESQALEVADSAKQSELPQTDAGPTISLTLPTRKRSLGTADIPDPTDIGRSRSKRIKARGSLDPDGLKDSTAEDWAKWYEEQLQIYHQADDLAFEMIESTLSKLGSNISASLSSLREIVVDRQLPSTRSDHTGAFVQSADLAGQDLKSVLDAWDLAKSKAFLNGHDPKDPAGGIGAGRTPSFAAFLESSSQTARKPPELSNRLQEDNAHPIEKFVGELEKQEWISLDHLAYRWLYTVLVSDTFEDVPDEAESWYETEFWPDMLKESVVRMLVFQDQAIYSELNRSILDIKQQDAKPNQHVYSVSVPNGTAVSMTHADEAKRNYTIFAQTIFELHLDVYGLITKPSSEVDEATRTLQCDRLRRWAALTSDLVNQWSWPGNDTTHRSYASDKLHIRFLWTTVVCNSLLEPTSRDNTILCYQDLILVLQSIDKQRPTHAPFTINLPNNAIIPEISVEAAKNEISRLTTMDFFMGILNPENTDPLTTIESLEPLLELSVKRRNAMAAQHRGSRNQELMPIGEGASTNDQAFDACFEDRPDSKSLEAFTFLKQGSVSLRLFLWQRLRDAYRAIAYPPQVISCDLRMITLIVDHLSSPSYNKIPQDSRRDGLLRWLHRLDDHVARALTIALTKPDAFDCLDSHHVHTSLEALTSLQRVLHVFALWEDTIRVGKTPPPTQPNQNAMRGLAKSTDKFRDMIVKIWTLQYTLLKEALAQNSSFVESPTQELAKHLERAHQALGLRCYCSLADKTLLRLMKKEFESFRVTGGLDVDMSQLMYDLYGVKMSLNTTEMQDHGCLTESLDRNTALEIMDLVMTQVNKISIKDLLKSDLKFTIDRMQQVIKIPKITNSTARTFNNRLVINYLKMPLNPYDLYRSLRGIGGLCGMPAYDEGFNVASKGWYSLLGHIALAKFRSTKRSSAGSTDDLSISKTFLRHDLEFDTDRWETWYRLSQVYDAMIEEDTTWTADKLDNHMCELVDLQRRAIHCYSMAIAVATRSAEGSFEDAGKMAGLFAEFGTRVYASTREPFSMKAFSLDDYKRHYNSRAVGMYQDLPFRSMQLYAAWRFASILLRRASTQKPQNWITSYVYGKVLWKMHNCSDEVRGSAKRIGYKPVIDAFVQAIEACPEKRDSRHPDKDPILEPHYKLLSVVHKLVRSRRILPEEGRRILQATPYARKTQSFQGDEGWNGYVWQILKALRAADKANWHHRMVARAAHIMYDDEPNDPRSAVGAKNELSQQVFTKTMAIQVWKPDNERPGRHFVYTGRYVRFFTRLLYQLNDRTNLEALARRIRKRVGDFVNHGSVWEEVCRAYLKLLHHQPYCPVTDGFSEIIFQGMDPENFQSHTARLETHVHALPTSPPYLDILREAIELKKLNNNLLKPINPFEDLIRDIYAHLYHSIMPDLIKNDAAEENRVRMRVDNILSNPTPIMIGTPPPEGLGAPGGEQPKKSGARYVTAREMVRKAEAIAAKPAPTVPAKVLKPLAPAPSSELGARPSSDAPRVAVVINADAANDAGSSAPGSVHDSADDESELSEVDDEVADAEPEPEVGDTTVERATMFPNLVDATANDVEEVEEDSHTEQADEEEPDERMELEDGGAPADERDDVDEQDGVVERRGTSVKESGVHEGNW